MLNKGCKKYIPFSPVSLPDRTWPDKVITKAPIWCSVDLRDGNQALIDPMNLEEKLLFFKTLVEIGFKEIEIGFPSASETEYEICRALIERNLIPDDVTIQVLVQCRPHLIQKTFEAIDGAKNVIVHFYNSTSTLQRKVVFKTDMQGVIDIAVEGAKLVRELTEKEIARTGANIRYEYSPESFSGTEIDNAVLICEKVLETLGATPENKVILNLPNTVEMSTPNHHADQIEYFCRNLKHRDCAIISLHPHNDRGTGTAATELGILAGAERVEGTLFGNGERTGNADIMNVAMNMFSQGVDPGLDFSDLRRIREIYEKCTRMTVPPRYPYAGDLVFTAFSGSHQDAISKGVKYMQDSDSPYWEVPYLPIDPADVGRKYEPIIRINSQSGKGGAAFVMQQSFGYELPKAMHPEFGAMVKHACDEAGRELKPQEIFDIFRREYLEIKYPYNLKQYKLYEENEAESDNTVVHFEGNLRFRHEDHQISGRGNGPIDAFFNALRTIGITDYQFVSYSEHAVGAGADSKALSYIQLRDKDGKTVFGAGMDGNISLASIKGIICAINRASGEQKKQ
ncbi:2-isopropylmalate synthase [Anaeromassilibacillus sp. An200]|uniref:2-isopropylmalate synthase n=1 Tax=Candidatus Caccousia stercoris TaxID=2840723 RepID=A0A9D1K3K3_9FIRM|nr:2-isopropylmalate synthase [Anaeromassilibacillus sp. An200]OUP13313.1 2-isopropylmalate synthase [Anaeromassilibacillus sp. An200]HIS79268.1 2-isopropylmalate synthase [Candidatus Caccousia stercoris]